MTPSKAIAAIKKYGVILVFPIQNRPEPMSLWSHFFPRSKMKWEWDQNGDYRVSDLWILREEISRSGKVVYVKWFQNRATFFSFEVFSALLADMSRLAPVPEGLSDEARQILETLEMNSPISSKKLRKYASLEGKDFEALYMKSLKQLWTRLLIVGYGEVDDGAFPSLAIGSTQNLFEDQWREAQTLTPDVIKARLDKAFPEGSALAKQLARVRRSFAI